MCMYVPISELLDFETIVLANRHPFLIKCNNASISLYADGYYLASEERNRFSRLIIEDKIASYKMDQIEVNKEHKILTVQNLVIKNILVYGNSSVVRVFLNEGNKIFFTALDNPLDKFFETYKLTSTNLGNTFKYCPTNRMEKMSLAGELLPAQRSIVVECVLPLEVNSQANVIYQYNNVFRSVPKDHVGGLTLNEDGPVSSSLLFERFEEESDDVIKIKDFISEKVDEIKINSDLEIDDNKLLLIIYGMFNLEAYYQFI